MFGNRKKENRLRRGASEVWPLGPTDVSTMVVVKTIFAGAAVVWFAAMVLAQVGEGLIKAGTALDKAADKLDHKADELADMAYLRQHPELEVTQVTA